jgi:hypothetical protein
VSVWPRSLLHSGPTHYPPVAQVPASAASVQKMSFLSSNLVLRLVQVQKAESAKKVAEIR